MGNICKVYCSECGYEEQFWLGAGRRDFDIERVCPYFDEMRVKDIRKEICDGKTKMLNFRFRLGVCNECGMLQRMPEITFFNGKSILGKNCGCAGNGKHEEVVYDEDTSEVVCPVCKKMAMIQNTGFWD